MLLKHPEAWAPLQTQWNLCLQQWGFGLWIFTISQMTDQSLFEPWCWIYFPRLQESFQGVVWEEAPPWVCHVDWTSAWRYSCTEACLSSLFPLRVSYCRQSKYVTLQKYFYLLFDCPESKLWHVESSSPTRDWTLAPGIGVCQLWIGPCQEHLPATEQQGHLPSAFAEIDPVLLQLLTFSAPEGNLGWRMRHSVVQGTW